jgi:hypothetical protein
MRGCWRKPRHDENRTDIVNTDGGRHVDAELCADELPHELPMFGLYLAIPVRKTSVQVFRLLKSRTSAALVLHDLLVHPDDFDRLGGSDVVGYLQAHGRLWALRCATHNELTHIEEVGGPIRLRLESDHELRVIDVDGAVIHRESPNELARDDGASLRVLQAPLRQAFGSETISAVLVRGYPGRTSSIVDTRPFPRLFASDKLRNRRLDREIWPPP